MKHTKGEWMLNRGNNGYSVTTTDGKIIIESCRNPIANLELWEQQLANAQLIASAPELLEACKEALIILPTGNIASAQETLIKAIAKAEGKK